eukprot:3354884-Amphidinium_carterae.1
MALNLTSKDQVDNVRFNGCLSIKYMRSPSGGHASAQPILHYGAKVTTDRLAILPVHRYQYRLHFLWN